MPYILLKEPVFIAGELKDAEEHAEVSKGLAANLVHRGKAELLQEKNTSSDTPVGSKTKSKAKGKKS